MSDKAILIGFEFIICSALVAVSALLIAQSLHLLSLFPLAVLVIVGAAIVDLHVFGRRPRSPLD